MSINPFIGSWTYRSFFNVKENIEDFNEIKLWQAEINLEEDGPNLVKGKIESGGYVLNIHGAVSTLNGQSVINMRAVGEENTKSAGWVYDYSGSLTLDWKTGDQQRPAIVGTVIRTMPHDPNRKADESFSFIAVNKNVPPSVYKLPENVVGHFSDKLHRMHHVVWHGIRNKWNNLTDDQRQKLKDLGWGIEGNRFSLYKEAEKVRPCITNGSGEDFLFSHRQMVVQYKKLMAEAGVTPIEWREIPQPGSGGTESPDIVPEAWEIPEAPNFQRRLSALKSDEFFWSRMRWWDYQYKDPTYLATLTLGELGSLIEFSVHNDMHIRWSAAPRDPETNALLTLGRPDYSFEEKWNEPAYDWLGDFYSSHVNPVFWRLHGWIDDRIDDWYAAHEWKHQGEIKRIDKGGVQWFESGTWVQVENPWVWPSYLGGYEHAHDHGHEGSDMREKRIASMKEVVEILFPPPLEVTEMNIDSDNASIERKGRTNIIGF